MPLIPALPDNTIINGTAGVQAWAALPGKMAATINAFRNLDEFAFMVYVKVLRTGFAVLVSAG